MIKITRTKLLAAAGAGATLLAVAAPMAASADAGPAPVTASGSVAETLTLSGVSPSVQFPPAQLGQHVTAPAAENYSVVATAPYSVTVVSNNDGLAFTPGGATFIRSSDMQVNGIAFSGGPSGAHVIAHNGNAGTQAYSDDWSMNMASQLPTGVHTGDTFSGQFSYTAIAS